MKYSPFILCDFYKFGHFAQYPENTEVIYETWTPRDSRIKSVTKVVSFGFQGFVKEFLIEYFNEMFFSKPVEEVVKDFERYVVFCLNLKPNTEHIRKLHALGYLPLDIRAVEEGNAVPIRCPMMTVQNTHPVGFWLPGFLETFASTELWQPATSATIAKEYHNILTKWAKITGASLDGIQFQAHDFSMRGMAGGQSGAKSGAGHLLSFVGTDTVPAIKYHEEYYGANVEKELVGCSIPATEHSVMEAWGRDELESFKYLLTQVYPTGFCSIVSDTWDFWKVVTEVLPQLKDIIMARPGRLVIRPDSGDPQKILCGDPKSKNPHAQKGLIKLLYEIFGGTVNDKGFKELDSHIGAIYGDSITIDRCEAICENLAKSGFSSGNVVYGVGSYTYQYVTRDTFGWALKATWGKFGGEERKLYKDPVTDSGMKKSQKGKVVVLKTAEGFSYVEDLTEEQQKQYGPLDELKPLFLDGKLLREITLAEIRQRIAK